MRSRRALLGLLAGGGVAAASWTVAEACSLAPGTCKSFRAGMQNTQGMVRAYVFEAVDASRDRVDGEWLRAVKLKARTTEVIVGAVREGRVFDFEARIFDCNGLELGYLPEKGETIVFKLQRDSLDEEWDVIQVQPAADYDRWLERCRIT